MEEKDYYKNGNICVLIVDSTGYFKPVPVNDIKSFQKNRLAVFLTKVDHQIFRDDPTSCFNTAVKIKLVL